MTADIYDIHATKRLRETEAIEQLIRHIKFLRKEQDRLEELLRKADHDKFGYMQGYVDGLRDAREKVEQATSVSNLLHVFKNIICKDINKLEKDATENAVDINGEPYQPRD